MLTFLEETVNHIEQKEQNLALCTLILPSKRASSFLKNILRKRSKKTQFLPTILSVEELIEELSGLQIINPTELLFKSYDIYKQTTSFVDKDSFENYTSWATTLLNDFNEADRYLLNTDSFFDYLGSIKTMERWNVSNQKTDFIENYVRFWKSLPEFYENIKTALLNSGIAYQGLVYREAVANIEHYLTAHGEQPHYFIGFNALNTAEQQIMQAFLENGHAEVLWDAEKTFVENSTHSASLFIRRYLKEWKYYNNHTPNFISNNFSNVKTINIVEGTKNMSQIKYVGQLLETYSEEKLNNTAIILADEHILLPLLHSLPKNVAKVNVTMGASLKTFPLTVFFETWLKLHAKNKHTYYYKDVISVLGHPSAGKLLDTKHLLTAITSKNKSHFTLQELTSISTEKDIEMVTLLFAAPEDTPKLVIDTAIALIAYLKKLPHYNTIERSVLYELFKIFKALEALQQRFKHIRSLQTFYEFFREQISNATIDFKGEAFEGLQIMGVLETRALDFENIIVLSVNEGILPSGKSNTSFITYDLKKAFNLPLYNEKDAIYTYHFYHMLHRAKEATLLYTNYSEGMNSGEKSRFLLQLEIEKQPEHILQKKSLDSNITFQSAPLVTIEKTPSVYTVIKEIAAKGFSPSALSNYIRNPIDFYFQRILKIQDFDQVEETVAFNTLGTIVHDTLENLYAPYVHIPLTTVILKEMRAKSAVEVGTQFSNSFTGGDISTGKNLLIFEVAKRYVENMIDLDLSEIVKGNKIVIQKLESDLKIPVPIPELDFPVFLHGKVDRVDTLNGQTRIIDYKTSKVQQGELELVSWEELTTDYAYSKAFQVLSYALMMRSELPVSSVEAGIVSFKNMANGFLKFGTKETPRSRTKNNEITPEILDVFEVELKKLILEICTMTLPFTEKEIN